jgi:hypothetical protein
MEAAWNGLDTTEVAFQATHYVNPIWNNLIGKTIILTLPTNLDLKRLTRFNKVISRYPLSLVNGKELKYDYIPYPEVEFKLNVGSNYSNKILNKYLLTSENSNISEGDRFLLGTEPLTNGAVNTVGYMLLKTIKN